MQKNLRHARKGEKDGKEKIGKITKVIIVGLAIAGICVAVFSACSSDETQRDNKTRTESTKIVQKSSVTKETQQSTVVTDKPESLETEPTTVKETETIADNKESDEFLLETSNVDNDYHGQPLYVSDSERTELAHLIMGEAGGEGFKGCCLLAQCVRDAMIYRGYSTISEVISGMGYNGYKYDTNKDVEDAINYIFIQGNSAVQHRILVMYASDLCEGEWHETQNFVYQHNAVRFFDMWNV
jgi:hypothetical protein